MNKLEILQNMGFKITWKLIYIGLNGLHEIPILLTREEILDYVDGLLTDFNEQTDNIILLICERDNPIMLNKIIKKLAENEESNTMLQIRKWRAYLLKTLMDNISKDCLQGLLELMEFWMSMGKPKDCPHIFPNSQENNLEEYFTPFTYDFLVNKNHDWLNQEIQKIIESEKFDVK